MLSLFLFLLFPVVHAQDYHGFYVTDGTPCGASDLDYPDDQAWAFRDVVDGWSWTSLTWGNLSVLAPDVADYPTVAWGTDHSSTGIDGADVGYISSHGGHVCDDNAPLYGTWVMMGDDDGGTYACNPRSYNVWLFNDNAHMIFLATLHPSHVGEKIPGKLISHGGFIEE